MKKDPSLYTEKGEILKKAFTEYKGKLAKYNNSMEIQKHNSDIETGCPLQFESPPRDLNLMNHNDNSSKNDDDSDSDYDFEDDDDYEDEDDTDENIPIAKENNNNSNQGQNVGKGPLAENLDILKEIASIKGYTPEEIDSLSNKYIEWITDDSSALILHNEVLEMGVKCWNSIEYLPLMKSLAKFVIPLLGIVASEANCERAFWKQRRILGDQCTRTSIEVEKARLNFAVNE
ncbi:hypothetical protein M9Y10_023586 [Tritrichomonas musculus]|uniref:HAT C-terminal dimerisation domain-containing protein n=1 Tax=Tritrichomonas musculus TaxID=1915356 RepID=A0ABR2KVJ5_9EUKA